MGDKRAWRTRRSEKWNIKMNPRARCTSVKRRGEHRDSWAPEDDSRGEVKVRHQVLMPGTPFFHSHISHEQWSWTWEWNPVNLVEVKAGGRAGEKGSYSPSFPPSLCPSSLHRYSISLLAFSFISIIGYPKLNLPASPRDFSPPSNSSRFLDGLLAQA